MYPFPTRQAQCIQAYAMRCEIILVGHGSRNDHPWHSVWTRRNGFANKTQAHTKATKILRFGLGCLSDTFIPFLQQRQNARNGCIAQAMVVGTLVAVAHGKKNGGWQFLSRDMRAAPDPAARVSRRQACGRAWVGKTAAIR